MKVKELIQYLQTLDPEMLVYSEDRECFDPGDWELFPTTHQFIEVRTHDRDRSEYLVFM